MKISGLSCITKKIFLVFLGHPSTIPRAETGQGGQKSSDSSQIMDGFPICRSTLSNDANSPVQKYLFCIGYKYGIEHSYDDLSKHVSSNSWKTEILCNKFKEVMSSYRLQGHELCR